MCFQDYPHSASQPMCCIPNTDIRIHEAGQSAHTVKGDTTGDPSVNSALKKKPPVINQLFELNSGRRLSKRVKIFF